MKIGVVQVLSIEGIDDEDDGDFFVIGLNFDQREFFLMWLNFVWIIFWELIKQRD